jgi:hypothetical protein
MHATDGLLGASAMPMHATDGLLGASAVPMHALFARASFSHLFVRPLGETIGGLRRCLRPLPIAIFLFLTLMLILLPFVSACVPRFLPRSCLLAFLGFAARCHGAWDGQVLPPES